jgi:Ca2+-binding EF-hand superfamily protein
MSFSRATGVYSVERVRDRAQLIMTIDGIGIRLENADGAVVEAAVYSYQEQQQPDGASPSLAAADELARMGVGQCGGSRSHPNGSRTPTLVFGAAENHGSGLVHARVIDSLLVVEIMKAGNFTEQMLRCESDRTAIKISRMLAENGNRQRLRWKVALRKQKNGLRAAFDAVDVDGNGTIGFSELRSMLSALGKSFTDAELRQVMRSLDVDASGHLEFHEFYDTMCSWQDQDLRDIFNYFDRDGDSLDVDEMAAVLKALGQELTIDDVIGLVKSLDYDCSGRVEVSTPRVTVCERHAGPTDALLVNRWTNLRSTCDLFSASCIRLSILPGDLQTIAMSSSRSTLWG